MGQHPTRILAGHLYEITRRTFQARYFFIPSKRLNQLVVGALAYAAEQYGLRFCYTAWLSNHCHHIIRADSQEQVRNVLRLANCQIAKEVQKICEQHGKPWTGGIFEKSKASIVEIEGGREIQLERLRYLMSQGVKEGLVPHPTKWPGVQSASAWLSGSMRLTGTWVDRSRLYEVDRGPHRRKKKVSRRWTTLVQRKACERKITLPLHPLPFMDELSAEERRQIAHELCSSILIEHHDKIEDVRRDWKKRLCDPTLCTYQPETASKDIVPEVHAESAETWRLWKIEWDNWVNQYERASDRLRKGIAEALQEFPEGCFVPSGVFGGLKNSLPPPLTA